jgi:hypothetical protein
MEDTIMGKMAALNKSGMLIGFLCFLFSLIFLNPVKAEDKSEEPPCPHPYIKRIQPKLAKVGEQVIIKGRRFREQDGSSEVIFPPGVSGKIISWRNTEIQVEVPFGAETGQVVLKTKCATSNDNFFKVKKENQHDKE